ncbi:unnamed protein product [Caenorhabditis auriculariae]|uniref:Uncharacterized protein n=1 Tax=Caenorhabditis auriculariae TaxID=2777116 RepID=A0A8S1HPH5_9PELO|nr:unnamed protein product [Caenorhabditis auriculariae]
MSSGSSSYTGSSRSSASSRVVSIDIVISSPEEDEPRRPRRGRSSSRTSYASTESPRTRSTSATSQRSSSRRSRSSSASGSSSRRSISTRRSSSRSTRRTPRSASSRRSRLSSRSTSNSRRRLGRSRTPRSTRTSASSRSPALNGRRRPSRSRTPGSARTSTYSRSPAPSSSGSSLYTSASPKKYRKTPRVLFRNPPTESYSERMAAASTPRRLYSAKKEEERRVEITETPRRTRGFPIQARNLNFHPTTLAGPAPEVSRPPSVSGSPRRSSSSRGSSDPLKFPTTLKLTAPLRAYCSNVATQNKAENRVEIISETVFSSFDLSVEELKRRCQETMHETKCISSFTVIDRKDQDLGIDIRDVREIFNICQTEYTDNRGRTHRGIMSITADQKITGTPQKYCYDESFLIRFGDNESMIVEERSLIKPSQIDVKAKELKCLHTLELYDPSALINLNTFIVFEVGEASWAGLDAPSSDKTFYYPELKATNGETASMAQNSRKVPHSAILKSTPTKNAAPQMSMSCPPARQRVEFPDTSTSASSNASSTSSSTSSRRRLNFDGPSRTYSVGGSSSRPNTRFASASPARPRTPSAREVLSAGQKLVGDPDSLKLVAKAPTSSTSTPSAREVLSAGQKLVGNPDSLNLVAKAPTSSTSTPSAREVLSLSQKLDLKPLSTPPKATTPSARGALSSGQKLDVEFSEPPQKPQLLTPLASAPPTSSNPTPPAHVALSSSQKLEFTEPPQKPQALTPVLTTSVPPKPVAPLHQTSSTSQSLPAAPPSSPASSSSSSKSSSRPRRRRVRSSSRNTRGKVVTKETTIVKEVRQKPGEQPSVTETMEVVKTIDKTPQKSFRIVQIDEKPINDSVRLEPESLNQSMPTISPHDSTETNVEIENFVKPSPKAPLNPAPPTPRSVTNQMVVNLAENEAGKNDEKPKARKMFNKKLTLNGVVDKTPYEFNLFIHLEAYNDPNFEPTKITLEGDVLWQKTSDWAPIKDNTSHTKTLAVQASEITSEEEKSNGQKK